MVLKFGSVLSTFGTRIKETSESVINGAEIVTAETDIRMFID